MAKTTSAKLMKRLPKDRHREADELLEKCCAMWPDRDLSHWIETEILDGDAELTRYSFLRTVWRECIDTWNPNPVYKNTRVDKISEHPNEFYEEQVKALAKMTGVPEDDIGELARLICFSTAWSLLEIIDEKMDSQLANEGPRWMLVEIDQNDVPTGRQLSKLSMDLMLVGPLRTRTTSKKGRDRLE